MENCVKSIKDVLVVTIVKTFFQWLIEILGFDGIPGFVFRHTTHDVKLGFSMAIEHLILLEDILSTTNSLEDEVFLYRGHDLENNTCIKIFEDNRYSSCIFILYFLFVHFLRGLMLLMYYIFISIIDSSKPAFQFGGNNVIFGGKKDAPNKVHISTRLNLTMILFSLKYCPFLNVVNMYSDFAVANVAQIRYLLHRGSEDPDIHFNDIEEFSNLVNDIEEFILMPNVANLQNFRFAQICGLNIIIQVYNYREPNLKDRTKFNYFETLLLFKLIYYTLLEFLLHHNEITRVYFLNHKIVQIMNTGHVTENVQTVISYKDGIENISIHIRRYKIAKDFAQ
ncbi:hypothetical protein ACJX0J_034956 [Zea mays]